MLHAIGLTSAIPTFKEAGINTKQDLITLKTTDFELLGIDNLEDRRKLLYLVSILKLEADKSKGTKKDNNKAQSRMDVGSMGSPTAQRIFTSLSSFKAAENNVEEEKKEEKKTESKPRRSRRLVVKEPNDDVFTTTSSSPSTSKTTSAKVGDVISKSSPVKTKAIVKRDVTDTKTSPPKKVVSLESKGEKRDDEKKTGITTAQVPSSDDKPLRHQQSSKSRISYARTGPESKLPGSLRTGKNLSAIPSESAAPPSPLVEFSSSTLNDEIERMDNKKKDLVATKQPKTKRRTTLAAGNGDELEELLQSSASESSVGVNLIHAFSETISDSDNESNTSMKLRQLPRLTKSRSSKSMSASDTALLKEHQEQQPQMNKRTSSSSRVIGRPSMLDKKQTSSLHTRSDTGSATSQTKQDSFTGPLVQGMSESESWVTQIQDLREDNDTEYELFRDQVDGALQEYYDMRIKVIVRKRPLSKSEATLTGGVDIIHPLDYGDFGKILVYQPKTRVDLTKEVDTIPFAFDNVFGESSTNLDIYERSLRHLVRPMIEKQQWATCFAYGQTNSGKTYTMLGSNLTGINAGTASNDESNLGLYYLAAMEIFDILQEPEYHHLNVHVSLFEIYGGGKLFDLLSERKQIKCLEDSKGKVCFPGLSEHPAQNPEKVMELIEQGAGNRSTGTTSRNADSSRSHAVLQLKLVKAVGRKKNVEHSK